MSKFYITNYNGFPKNYFNPLLIELEEKGFKFNFLDKPLFSKDLQKLSGRILFILSLPILFLRAKKVIETTAPVTIICHSWSDRFVFTLLKKYKNINIQWWFFPQADVKAPWLQKYLKKQTTGIKFVAFTPAEVEKIDKIWDKATALAPLGIKLADKSHQDSIFGGLGRSPKLNFFHKYFTIIAAANLNEPNYIETIIKSVPELLKVVRNLQLLIISPQNTYKRWEWLSKQIEVEKNVWFLKEPQHFKSWLESGTLFFLGNKAPKIDQLHWLFMAMAQGLPTIGFKNQGLESFILNNKCALITEPGRENFVQSIITLARDNQYKKELSLNTKRLINSEHNLSNQLEIWEEILN